MDEASSWRDPLRKAASLMSNCTLACLQLALQAKHSHGEEPSPSPPPLVSLGRSLSASSVGSTGSVGSSGSSSPGGGMSHGRGLVGQGEGLLLGGLLLGGGPGGATSCRCHDCCIGDALVSGCSHMGHCMQLECIHGGAWGSVMA